MCKASAEIDRNLGLMMNTNDWQEIIVITVAYFAPASKQKRSNDNDSSQL